MQTEIHALKLMLVGKARDVFCIQNVRGARVNSTTISQLIEEFTF